ncbi:MAG: hypothetical protein WEA56_10110 [Balneolaceae bacterium]
MERKRDVKNIGTEIRFLVFLIAFAFMVQGCLDDDDITSGDNDDFPLIEVPQGYEVEKVTDDLTYPSSLAWDDEGRLYVAEAGGGLNPETLAPISILEIENGEHTVVANLENSGIVASVVGLVWHNGDFYITHRAEDLTGAVSRVSMDGEVTNLFDGIIDSQSEHQINDIRVGPDGLMYITVGPAGNAGVVDKSVGPWVMESPELHPRPCQDITLHGINYQTPDFRPGAAEGDSVITGAFVPFGTETSEGQVIEGVELCGGSILKFDPDNPGNIQMHAWGFRNIIGISWDSEGQMYAAENGYDVRGSRPVGDDMDASLKIEEGRWYGVPDFSAGREPLTDERFIVEEDSLLAMVVVNGEPQGKGLGGFLINHEASNLTPPDPTDVLGSHEINSSPSMMDVAPDSWGDWADHVFIAEWGDLSPPTNPIRGEDPAQGYRVVRVDPNSGDVTDFLSNSGGGAASHQQQEGGGIERPFDVQFGPDDAMYIVDYGVVNIDMNREPPYDYKAGTGVIWKVSRQEE